MKIVLEIFVLSCDIAGPQDMKVCELFTTMKDTPF